MKKCYNEKTQLLMAALFFLVSALSALIYFGIVRRLNEKWLEIVHFLALYLLLQAPIMIFVFFKVHSTHYENFNMVAIATDLVAHSILPILFYTPSSFVVSLLLYPFKIVKRYEVLIWMLSIILILILAMGVVALVEIAHAFSNM
jgi:hypothetical protein